ncbi:hypothetical protein [Erythrobacter dokdonensis]|uniref:Uncharacterized protein n=1 Tax=Erythrobacter dokdonensis DSW-74 TaxID=1300349 RepID=A0A1A7BG99_9SPHN|nr:hypothetical protein [Erythrobacter dokdonensis]OBV11568.1 hypothetical protein I603_1011 [Erythrobacter dokdonensis DSW-74]
MTARALYEVLRFAVTQTDMSDEMARCVFDRAVKVLPDSWVVTHITPAAVAAFVANGLKTNKSGVERAHYVQRNRWQRELLQALRDGITFEAFEEHRRYCDRTVLTTRGENRSSDDLTPEFIAACI